MALQLNYRNYSRIKFLQNEVISYRQYMWSRTITFIRGLIFCGRKSTTKTANNNIPTKIPAIRYVMIGAWPLIGLAHHSLMDLLLELPHFLSPYLQQSPLLTKERLRTTTGLAHQTTKVTPLDSRQGASLGWALEREWGKGGEVTDIHVHDTGIE